MQDKDAAKTTPGGNNMSVVNELSSDEAPVFAGSALNEQEKPKTRYRILVVEDETDIADVLCEVVAQQGHRVDRASVDQIAPREGDQVGRSAVAPMW